MPGTQPSWWDDHVLMGWSNLTGVPYGLEGQMSYNEGCFRNQVFRFNLNWKNNKFHFYVICPWSLLVAGFPTWWRCSHPARRTGHGFGIHTLYEWWLMINPNRLTPSPSFILHPWQLVMVVDQSGAAAVHDPWFNHGANKSRKKTLTLHESCGDG